MQIGAVAVCDALIRRSGRNHEGVRFIRNVWCA
jgi:hypothetical protein